jgi:hypothetical protein
MEDVFVDDISNVESDAREEITLPGWLFEMILHGSSNRSTSMRSGCAPDRCASDHATVPQALTRRRLRI